MSCQNRQLIRSKIIGPENKDNLLLLTLLVLVTRYVAQGQANIRLIPILLVVIGLHAEFDNLNHLIFECAYDNLLLLKIT